MTEKHPLHNCKDCGILHNSYEDNIKFAHKNRKTRNILIVIACVSILLIPLSLTIFDLIKEPYQLESSIDLSLFTKGYDVVCNSDFGMQLCIIKGSESNHMVYNKETFVIQSKLNPCLNIYLETSDAVNDKFMSHDGIDCVASLEFPIKDGWNYYQYTFIEDDDFHPEPKDIFFTAEKVKYWWSDWWFDL